MVNKDFQYSRPDLTLTAKRTVYQDDSVTALLNCD